MPDRMPEDMSDRMPEDLPVRKCINVMVGIIRSEVILFKNVFFFSFLNHIKTSMPKHRPPDKDAFLGTGKEYRDRYPTSSGQVQLVVYVGVIWGQCFFTWFSTMSPYPVYPYIYIYI